MDYKRELEKEHSKKLTNLIVDDIIARPQNFDSLINLLLNAPYRITQRAAWPISVIAEKHPGMIEKYLPILINKLHEKGNHPSINRNIVRALQYVTIPENLEGKTLEICFQLLNSSNEPVAVKVFSMTVVYNLAVKYSDIRQELIHSIETQLEHQSAGFRSRGNKILKQLGKLR
jgi:hypothetical protein